MIRAILVGVLLTSTPAYAQDASFRDAPDPSLTPGLVASTDQTDVCSTGGGTYSQRHRLSQNEETKKLVLSRYNVPWAMRAKFEDDHDVPLSLGGSDSVNNRWPQPRFGTWTSAMKDKLETHVWEMVCHKHAMTLAQGQAIFLAPAAWKDGYCHLISGSPCP